jgi:DNA modification methylase
MKTIHNIYFAASQNMQAVQDATVDLVVTSPPYPMIEMWDEIMGAQNPQILEALEKNPNMAFELMNVELDKVWKECHRVLKEGGFLCINIGDATRTINGNFQLFNNSSRITNYCTSLGFYNLPNILWRKPTNAPNKFMGSGMLPCGAYVTLEHEWILIFRKGEKRPYKTELEKRLRRESSFFWEERNVWFSDIWEVKGTKQIIANSETRERNASFPITIPYRLINMYSQRGDVVLDPFFGLGTTTLAAMISGRNSIGFEIDNKLSNTIIQNIKGFEKSSPNKITKDRIMAHRDFVVNRENAGKEVKYFNENIGYKVMTKQETDIKFDALMSISQVSSNDLCFACEYEEDKNLYIPNTLF